jgi:hypothetical protein
MTSNFCVNWSVEQRRCSIPVARRAPAPGLCRALGVKRERAVGLAHERVDQVIR